MSFLVDYGKFFRMAFSQNISRRLFGSLRYGTHPTSFAGHRFWILYQIDVKLKRASLKEITKLLLLCSWVGFVTSIITALFCFPLFPKFISISVISLQEKPQTFYCLFWSESSKELCNIWYNISKVRLNLRQEKYFLEVWVKSLAKIFLCHRGCEKNRKKHLINIWSSIYANYHILLLSAVIFKSKFIFRPD